MKIIGTDNFDRETVDDKLIAENICSYYANKIVDLLNNDSGPNSYYYYKAVEDDYVLYDSTSLY